MLSICNYMLSIGSVIAIGLCSGLALFLLCPCCKYWCDRLHGVEGTLYPPINPNQPTNPNQPPNPMHQV